MTRREKVADRLNAQTRALAQVEGCGLEEAAIATALRWGSIRRDRDGRLLDCATEQGTSIVLRGVRGNFLAFC